MNLFCQNMQVCENCFTEIVKESNFRNHLFCIIFKKEYAIVEEKEIGSEIITIYLPSSKT